MRIREVSGSELARLKEIRLRALADAPYAYGSSYERERDRDPEEYRSWITNGVTFVAEDEEGWHALGHGRLDAVTPSLAYVMAMWVAPERRGTKLGATILDTVIDWARQQGASMVSLGVTDGNSPAQKLYRSRGFQPTGEREPLKSDPTRECVFLERPT
ncbi:MAG: GNAT family N-acetyltransferase [Actinobacteria bacterium]|nr:GNAT family N-acetyltransferase [Actinomycetota bacterium]MBV9662415.1 GNAT family N-acetyltransferase [Actinomycetota bacterium]MBV9933711.1 GNAT family N-acetyltransferase [Actinomycetota bacterium]